MKLIALTLPFKHTPARSPLIVEVIVPVGSEDYWVERFKTYPIVKSAGRLGIVEQS